jgi:hypothetical protein
LKGHDFTGCGKLEAEAGFGKLEAEGGGGLNPRIKPAESTRASAPENALPNFTRTPGFFRSLFANATKGTRALTPDGMAMAYSEIPWRFADVTMNCVALIRGR